jgi:competence protein ComFC
VRIKLKKLLNIWYRDLVHVLFPDLCLSCNKEPKTADAWFCVTCIHQMPYTDHFEIGDNNVVKHFKGRVKIAHGAAILRFKDGSIVQNMLHQLKYKDRKEISEVFGKIGAEKLRKCKLFPTPDIIIPVPIHRNKQKKRGYNQSSIFGKSIGNYCNIAFSEETIVKMKETESQTGKSRTERVSNVRDGFNIKDPESLKFRNVLIVDDVITTGATLEAVIQLVWQCQPTSVSVLSIAATE